MTNAFDDEEDVEERYRDMYGFSRHYWLYRKQTTNVVKKRKPVTKKPKRKVVKKKR
jgi:hypothetical protein